MADSLGPDAALIARLRDEAVDAYVFDIADRFEALTTLSESNSRIAQEWGKRTFAAEARLARAEKCIEQVREWRKAWLPSGSSLYDILAAYDTAKEQPNA